MATKMTIIEGNNNDRDNTRAFMVKGADGVSPTVQTSKTGTVATVTITDVDGDHTFTVNDGVSPTVNISKTDGVTTIAITDAEGTQTATINDGTTYAKILCIMEEGLTEHNGQAFVPYPTGFNKNNTIVLNAIPKNNLDTIYQFNLMSKVDLVEFYDNEIAVRCYDANGSVVGLKVELIIVRANT